MCYVKLYDGNALLSYSTLQLRHYNSAHIVSKNKMNRSVNTCHLPRQTSCRPNTMTLLGVCFLFHLLLLPPFSQAGELIIDDSFRQQSLDPALDYLFDQQQILHLGQIIEGDSKLAWQPGEQRENALIMESGLYWFKGQISNRESHAIELTLQTEYPTINTADLYIISDNGDVTTVYADAGIDHPFDNRPTPHRNLVNTITVPANGTMMLIWRIESKPLFQFRATLWNPQQFIERNQHQQILYGMIYGTLLVMTLYNLFLFVSTREKSYLYYVLYVLSFTYILSADKGHLYQYIASDQAWAKLPIYALAYTVNILMFSQFSIYFLNLHERSRHLLWTIRALALISALTVIGVSISNSLTLVFFGLFTLTLMFMAALIAGVIVRKAGVISAGHFVIAIMILVFSLLASNMATLGLISKSGATESLAAIGTTVMMIFFSLALADRINQLQKENTEAGLGMTKANTEKLKAEQELRNSQHKRLQLEQSSAQARRESRAKSDFLATLSNEIRTPMSSMLGMTELMKDTALTEQQTHYLNTIEHAGQSLLTIIRDLQDFAKIEAGKMELEISSFNLETLLDDCISTFASRAVEKNISFIADLEPSIDPVLRGDATKLRQIILNLLSNAFKFTDQGDILLSVHATDKSSINSVELKFEIQDSGIGLTPQEQQRLFTPFQQADENTYGRYGGSGLGLAISRQLAELMDGHIGLVSEAGKGSCFWFTVRLLIEENPDPTLLREKSSRLAGQHLLLVDPNPVTADILCRLLESWQIKTQHCSNTQDALDSIDDAYNNDAPFTVIVSEYHLTNGDGLTLAKTVKQRQTNPPGFVLMAASRYLENQPELDDAGIHIVLEKPVTTALLHDALKRTISDPQQPRPERESPLQDKECLHVLVVEDNQANHLIMQDLLKRLGITPDLTINARQALKRCDEKHYDLILMDCELPETDGYEATVQIRSKEKQTGRTPATIVALSAHASSHYQQRAQQAGMDSFLTKPITFSDLQAVIRRINHQHINRQG